jgi:hypothetical protein
MYQAVENRVGYISQKSRRSASDNGAVAPVVDHQNIEAAEPGQQTSQAAIGPRDFKIA